VETVEKKPGLSRAKSFQGDASKVIIQGTGLKKGFVGRAGTFSLDVKDAGITSLIFHHQSTVLTVSSDSSGVCVTDSRQVLDTTGQRSGLLVVDH